MVNVKDGKLIFAREASLIHNRYPTLLYEIRSNVPILFGSIELVDDNGKVFDVYEIEIHYKIGYPYQFPYVYEIGGKIPRNIDWHVFESTGCCCIKVFPEEILICKSGIGLEKFIDEQVIPYFHAQSFRRENGYFLKERSHGMKGWLEFFSDVIKTDNIANIIFILKLVMQRQEPNRQSDCFCGSKKKYRKCHKDSYKLLSIFSNEDIGYYIEELEKSDRYKTQVIELYRKFSLP